MTPRDIDQLAAERGIEVKRVNLNPAKLANDRLFDELCRRNGIPPAEKEYRFDKDRRWRFDYAWPQFKLAAEKQGAIHSGGRHVRGAALVKEYEKLNAACIAGWRLLFLTTEQFETGDAFAIIARAINHSPATEGT